jgi:hypothetical protein
LLAANTIGVVGVVSKVTGVANAVVKGPFATTRAPTGDPSWERLPGAPAKQTFVSEMKVLSAVVPVLVALKLIDPRVTGSEPIFVMVTRSGGESNVDPNGPTAGKVISLHSEGG